MQTERSTDNRKISVFLTKMNYAKLILWAISTVILFSLSIVIAAGQNKPNEKDLLTAVERQWLSEHDGLIRIGITEIPVQVLCGATPRDYKGISIDYIRLLERNLRCKFQLVYYKTWNEVMQAARKKEIDMIFAAQKTPERSKYLLFSKPYIELPNMIIVRKDMKGHFSLKKMTGLKIVCSEGSAVNEFLKEKYGYLDIHPVANELSGLIEVSFGEADAMVVELSRASYYIEKAQITNLRVAGNAGFKYELRFASRKDWPILNSILDKGLSSISDHDREIITRKWITFGTETIFASRLLWISLGVGLAVIILILLGIISWNRTLKRQVEQHTARLQQELTERRLAEQKAGELAAIVRSSDDAIIGKDLDGIITSWNKGAEKIYGYAASEVVGRPITLLVPPGQADEVPQILARIKSGEHIEHYETVRRRKDGQDIHLSLTVSPIIDAAGRIVAASTIARDITARRQVENIGQARLRLLEFANLHSLDELLTATLDEIELLTGSSIGFYHFLEADQQTLSLQNWSTNTLQNMCTATGKGRHYDISQAGVWVDCIHERRPVIHNDYASLPHRKGLPEGHAPVVRQLVVPLSRGNQIKAIIGVGNKATNYDDRDIEIVSQLGDLSWDIVERKQAEEALRQSEQKFRLLYDKAPLGYQSLDEAGLIIEVNQTWLDILGFAREEVIGHWVGDFLAPGYVEIFKKNFPRFKEVGEICDIPFELVRRDGTIITASFNGKIAYDVQGRFLRTHCMFQDITARQEAEEELAKNHQELQETARQLEQSRNMLQLVIESIPVRVFWKGKDFRYLGCNTFFAHDAGLSQPEQLLGMDDFAMGWREQAELYRADDRQVMESGTPKINIIEPQTTPTGAQIWLSTSKVPLQTPDGEVFGILGVYEDITERKRAEEAVAAERQRFYSLLEAMPAYVGLLTPDYRVNFANLYFRQAFGEPAGRTCYDYIFGRSEPCENCQALKVLETGKEDYEWIGPNGHIYQICDQLVHDTDGSPLILEMGIDITERKQAEEALRQTNETLRATLDAAPVAIFDLDMEGRVKSLWNAAAEQMLGWSRAEALGHFLPSVPEEGKEEFARFLESIRAGKSIIGKDLVRRRKDGSRIEYSLYAAPEYDADGQVIGNIAVLVDITERKQAEAQLLLLNFALGHIREAVYLIDESSRFLFINDEACRALGYSREELLDGMGVLDIGPDWTEEHWSLHWRELKAKGSLIFEAFQKARDGRIFPVEITANIFPYEGTDYNFALVRDISERKRAERSLAEQVRFLQHLIDTIPSPIFFKDANGVYLGCNQSLAEFLGKPKGEIIGKTVFEIYPREHAEIFYQKDQALFEHPGTQIYEFMMERFDGTLRDFIFTKATFVNLAGKMAGLIGVMTDITERQQMEQALAVREREYRTLLENIPDLIVRYDLDMRRIYVNPAWEKASGLSAGEVINKPTAEIPNVPHPVVVEYAEKLRQVAEAGGPQALEFTWVNALGVTLFLEYVIVPEYDRSGKIVSVLAVGRDLTDRRRAEEEIRKLNLELEQRVIERTAELEAANQELEAFAYSVSHDLRAPLRHVDGFLELLQKRITAGLDDKSQHYMATIFESTRRMGMLIDDLLSFSRMGRCEMLKKPVDLNVLVQEVIEEFKPETRDRLIRWQIADLPKVIGDRAMLRIVQVNLISNALKFSRPRQEAEIEIGWRPGHGTEIIIFIRDNGVGFDMNYAGNLFGVFQRLHRMEEFEGTGIGLANVRRIINRHGGRTWAEGKVDQGATFFFSLP